MKGTGPALERVVLVNDGFGAVPYTSGTAIFVVMIDGGKARMNGYDVERLATADESKKFIERTNSALAPKLENILVLDDCQTWSGIEGATVQQVLMPEGKVVYDADELTLEQIHRAWKIVIQNDAPVFVEVEPAEITGDEEKA